MHLRELILLREIDFSCIKNEQAKSLFEKILRKDSSKRITLEEIFGDPWVTKNGQEIIEPDQVQHFNNGFIGNVERLIRMNSMGQNTHPTNRCRSLNVATESLLVDSSSEKE